MEQFFINLDSYLKRQEIIKRPSIFKQNVEKPKQFRWTQNRKNCLVLFIAFMFFWELILQQLRTTLEHSEKFDNFVVELLNLRFLNYFVTFFEHEVQELKIISFLNKIYFFNLYVLNFYNFSCLLNKELNLKRHTSFLKFKEKNLINGQISVVKKEAAVTYSIYKRYFVDENNKEIDLDTYVYEPSFYWKDLEAFLDKNWTEEEALPKNLNEFFLKFGKMKKTKADADDLYVLETLFGSEGSYDLRFLYAKKNRLRREEIYFFTDSFFYYKLLDKLSFYFYIINEISLRILELFVLDWTFLYFNNLYFNSKWEMLAHFIFPKSGFLLKVDYFAFMFLTKYISYYRTFIYDKYIFTHKDCFYKVWGRLLYTARLNLRLRFREWRVNLEFFKNLKQDKFLIIKVSSFLEKSYLITYDFDVYLSLVRNMFLKWTLFLDRNFLKGLHFSIRKQRLNYFNYIYYKIFMEAPCDYFIETWWTYHYDNVRKYFNFIRDQKILILNDFISYHEVNFISKLFSLNNFVKNYYLVADFSQPHFLAWKITFELKLLWRFLKVSLIKFIKSRVDLKNFLKQTWKLDEALTDEEFWFDWFLTLFYKDNLNKKLLKVQLIDFFIFSILRLNRRNKLFTLISDKIDYSRYLSNMVLCQSIWQSLFKIKNLDKFKSLSKESQNLTKRVYSVFRFKPYITLFLYKDLILNLISSSLILSLLFFHLLKLNNNVNKNIYKYFYLRYYIWNNEDNLNNKNIWKNRF